MVPMFQAVVLAIFYGFSVFLPISAESHLWAIPYFFDWHEVSIEFKGALAFSSLLALLVYFRHDWASIFASFLRVVLLWQKPRTIDERMPFFVLASLIPLLLAWHFFQGHILPQGPVALWIGGGLILFSLPLGLSERLNRKTKTIFNWNVLDAVLLGFCQILFLIPGGGRQVGAFTGAYLKNYNLEAALKFAFYSFLPLLILESLPFLNAIQWSGSQPLAQLNWLSLIIVLITTFFCGLMAIGGLMKNLASRGMRGYLTYRCLLGVGLILVYFFKH